MTMRGRLAAWMAAALLVLSMLPASAPAAAQPSPAERVRNRILDGCVMASAGTPRAANPVPQCRCYAKGVVRAMTPADLKRYLRTGTVSDALSEKAGRILHRC